MSFRSAEYGAFQRTGGRGISSLTLSRPHCSICSFRYFSVPSIAKAQRASWSYTKGYRCWRWVISVASFVWQKLVFFRCLNMLLLTIIWRTAALWREKNSNLRGGKIALLFRGLNMYLLRITLEHSWYLNERKTINLRSGCKEFRDRISSGSWALRISRATFLVSKFRSAFSPMRNVAVRNDCCLSLTFWWPILVLSNAPTFAPSRVCSTV